MKLVDILARELKVWPEDADSLSQSFGGMVFYISSLVQLKTLFRTEVSEDWREAMVFKPQWQAAVDALKVDSAPAWVGVGLPPVDLPCMWHSDGQTGWQEVVVLAYSGESAWIQPKGKPSIIVGNPANFLPIRTPEQIAKQERSKACDKMFGVILDRVPQDRRNNGSDICEALYDAGYRKFEIVDN